MQFLIIAYDGKDEGAFERRMVAREQHITVGDEMVRQGKALFGAAILDNDQKMVGSIRVVDFPSQAEPEEWLKKEEPYVRGEAWEEVTITPCRIGPSYEKLFQPEAQFRGSVDAAAASSEQIPRQHVEGGGP